MIYTNNTKKAIRIMFENHKNQLDKANTPYVFHPWHVAEAMSNEKSTIVALLHDLVEDTNITLNDLRKEGFDEEILAALEILTHDNEEEYFEYIKNVATNPIAREVKIADLKHNLDLNRLDSIKQEDLQRAEKYSKCLYYLQNYNQKVMRK